MTHKVLRICFSTLILGIGLCQIASAATEKDQAPSAAAEFTLPKQLPNHLPTLQLLSLQALNLGHYEDFVRVLEHARTLRPDDPQLMVQLVAGYAQLQDPARAYSMMITMQKQGLSFDFNTLPQTEPIRSTEVYKHVNEFLKTAGDPFGYAEAAFTLPDNVHMPESIAWDPDHQQFIIGTVRKGQILRLTQGGHPAPLPAPFDDSKLYAVFGLAVDTEHKTLWVSTTAVGQWSKFRPQDYGLAALQAYDLDSGQIKAEYHLTPDGQPHGFGNLALAADGSVFVADTRQPMVHVLRHGEQEIKPLFVSQDLTNLRGMAYNDAQHLLYVADRETGITFWSEQDQRLYRMGKPDTLNLSGIDGLNFWENHLLVIQNGITPERVSQIRLSENGRNILAQEPLAAALESFSGPSYGAVVGNQYYFFAANHWGAFDLQGRRLAGSQLDPVPVLKLPLAPLALSE